MALLAAAISMDIDDLQVMLTRLSACRASPFLFSLCSRKSAALNQRRYTSFTKPHQQDARSTLERTRQNRHGRTITGADSTHTHPRCLRCNALIGHKGAAYVLYIYLYILYLWIEYCMHLQAKDCTIMPVNSLIHHCCKPSSPPPPHPLAL